MGLRSGDKEGNGRIVDVVIGKELCGVCCMGSAIVVLKYSDTQCSMREIRQQKICVSFFFFFLTLYIIRVC